MSKKRIGIVGSKMGENSFGATVTYLTFIEKFGDPIIIMPHEEIAKVDALLLPGGLDIPPAQYGQHPSFYTTNQDVFKQYFLTNRLQNYIGKVPIFGVCLGFQMINVAMGGSLAQNLTWHIQSKDRWESAHEVIMDWGKFKNKVIDVNSHHHQGVLQSTLSHDLMPVAVAKNEENKNDYIVEAVLHYSLPIAGVQWHPEELYDEFSMSLFDHILKQA